MIKTKEEINLLYLEGTNEFITALMQGKIQANDETLQAVQDLDDPILLDLYWGDAKRSCPPLNLVGVRTQVLISR